MRLSEIRTKYVPTQLSTYSESNEFNSGYTKIKLKSNTKSESGKFENYAKM